LLCVVREIRRGGEADYSAARVRGADSTQLDKREDVGEGYGVGYDVPVPQNEVPIAGLWAALPGVDRAKKKTRAETVNSVERSNVDITELQLVDGAAAGNRDARRALFERYRDVAFHVALRITRREEDALDVVQDSFIRAFERLGEFQREAGFRTWLLRIVSNRALDLLRSRKVRLAVRLDGDDDERAPEVPSGDPVDQPDYGLEQQELAQRLKRAVDRLPTEQRAVFALYATGEMTYGQIAEVLGIPIGTVMSRLFHARKRLHELLPDLVPSGGKETASEDGTL